MKILVVAHYQTSDSPVSSFIHDQARAMQQEGHELLMLVPVALGKTDCFGERFGSTVRRTEIGGLRYVFVRFLSLSYYGRNRFNACSSELSLRCGLLGALRAFAPDIILAHTLGFDSEIGVFLKRRLGCPLVVTTHGSDAVLPLDEGRQALVKRWCEQADAIVCVGEKLCSRLAALSLRTPLYTIHNGFNDALLVPTHGKKPLSLLQVCNLYPSKRTDVTIRAFAQVRGKYPAATLTVVGEGGERLRLERLCRELGVEGSVRFTGQLTHDEVFREMAAAEYFVMVSKPEGFGIVYLEAMASGCMAIGAQGEGIADVIVSGENGFLLPADDPDAIAETVVWGIEHPEERRAIAERGRACASVMTWEKNAQRTLTLFRELLEKRDALRR